MLYTLEELRRLEDLIAEAEGDEDLERIVASLEAYNLFVPPELLGV